MNILPDAQPVQARIHAARLWRLIAHELEPQGTPEPDLPWDTVLRPLHIATSIDRVAADTAYVDESQSVMYCRPAAEYEDAHSALVSTYVKELTVFVWTWMAFENAIDMVCGRSSDRIGNAARYIKTRTPSFTFVGLPDVEARALDLVGSSEKKKIHKIAAKFVKKNKWSYERHLFFLYIVREARNSFIHGDIPEIQPRDWGPMSTYRVDDDENVVAVRVFTQLSLFGLQMLLLATTVGMDCRLEHGFRDAPTHSLLREVLQVIHLNEDDYLVGEKQPQLGLHEFMRLGQTPARPFRKSW